MSDISPNVNKLAEQFQGQMEQGEGGVLNLPAKAYEQSLPEDLSMDTVKRVKSHDEDVVAALTLATGRQGEQMMKNDKGLQSVSSSMKFGKFGDVNVQYDRAKVGPKSITDRTEVTRYGQTQARVRTFAGKPRGDLKKVRETLASNAEKLFG
tara:strand:+ start:20046 stop:20501 length:456 start_codon:yes stop_codon:yes gene_type:complete